MTESCNEHRDLQRLLALRRRLAEGRIEPEKRGILEREIARLEALLGLD